jgi:hypothetical protein
MTLNITVNVFWESGTKIAFFIHSCRLWWENHICVKLPLIPECFSWQQLSSRVLCMLYLQHLYILPGLSPIWSPICLKIYSTGLMAICPSPQETWAHRTSISFSFFWHKCISFICLEEYLRDESIWFFFFGDLLEFQGYRKLGFVQSMLLSVASF